LIIEHIEYIIYIYTYIERKMGRYLESYARKSSSEKEEEMVIETPFGCLRGKLYIKAAVQSAVFLMVVGCYGALHLYQNQIAPSDTGKTFQRHLNGTDASPSVAPTTDSCKDILENVADPKWMIAPLVGGVLYMFLALAIACDEFFVPALEEMSGPRRLNLSMDVAGATLMAAGGSAPELFTAFIGTFQRSAIGFGTIVGSAVFNVLFVIAMCSLLAKEVLELTWWPLFRDSLYYVMGLAVLAAFVGFNSKGLVELWEACVLLALYFGYVLVMWQNGNLYKLITGKSLEEPGDGEPTPEEPTEMPADEEGQVNRDLKKQHSKSASLVSTTSPALHHGNKPAHFRWQGTFRAGILKLLKDPGSWMDTAGLGLVAKIAGDADYVFSQVDIDGNGHIDREELKQLFNLLECYISPGELEEVFNQLDEDQDGTVCFRTVHFANVFHNDLTRFSRFAPFVL
jgi:sodium/potassium/calcium exchanger 2